MQSINQNYYQCFKKATNIHYLNRYFSNEKIQQESQRLYQKKNIFPRSISNYELSHDQILSQSAAHCRSILFTNSRNKNDKKFDNYSYIPPIATFDEIDDDDNDSISRDSSFRSCLNSINDFLDNNTNDSSLSLPWRSYFHQISSIYHLDAEIFDEKSHHARLSLRHLCNLQ